MSSGVVSWTRGEPAGNLRVAGRDRLVGGGPPSAVQIDLREDYCWALMRALTEALEFADEDVCELTRCVEYAEDCDLGYREFVEKS